MNTLAPSKCLSLNSYLSVFEVICDNGSKVASEPCNDRRERSGPKKQLSSYRREMNYV